MYSGQVVASVIDVEIGCIEMNEEMAISGRGAASTAGANIAASVNGLDLGGLRAKQAMRWRLGLLVGALDLISIVTAYLTASLVYLNSIEPDQIGRLLMSLLPIVLFLNLSSHAYSAEVIREQLRSAWRGASGLVWASLIMFLLFFFLKISDEFSRVVFTLGTLLAIGLITVGRMTAAATAQQIFGPSPFAYIYIYDGIDRPSEGGQDSVTAHDIGIEPRHDDPDMLDRFGRMALGVDGVVVYCTANRREDWAFMLKSLDVATEIVTPELSKLRPLSISSRLGEASLVLGSGQLSWGQRTLKRSFDLVATLVLMPVLLPALLLIGLAVRIDSKGPALFRQDRIGLGNRKFQILKFRTMRAEVLDHEASNSTSRSDPRVTRVGDFLRRTSLDEIPQFLNVLWGDMSIVGPRPHAQRTAIDGALLWEIDAAYWHRHVLQPGITGLAQVRGHRGSLFEEKQLRERLNADLEYVANWSLANDLKIILRTVGVLVHKNAF